MDKVNFPDQKQLLFGWLYDPFTIPPGSIDNTLTIILTLSKQYGIDKTIIIKKIIDFLSKKQYAGQQIIDILYEKQLLNNDHLEKISQMLDSITPTIKPLNNTIITKICNLANSYKYNSTEDKDLKKQHENQPLPDPNLGRPRLEYLTCMHEDCNRVFNTPDRLIAHLQACKAYTYGFHKWHEDSVLHTHLTPEKVMQKKITKCPSMTCWDSKFETPEALCKHLQYLGIEPFWQKGMKLTYKKDKVEDIKIGTLYIGDECVICCEDNIKPSVVFQPCNHASLCMGCYQTMNKCPICRSPITNAVPI